MNKNNQKVQIISYLIIFILVMVFLSTIGLKILIGVSTFIAGRNTEQTQPQDKQTRLLLAPEITDIPDATNSAQLKIRGTAESKMSLVVYVNDEKQKEIVIADDQFETEIILNKGENAVYLIVEDPKTKEKKESTIYTVFYKEEKLKLEITSPHDRDTVSKEEIQITGETDKGATVRINSLPVVVDANGKFSYFLKLKEGDNSIGIQAQDDAGNIEQIDLMVTYRKDG